MNKLFLIIILLAINISSCEILKTKVESDRLIFTSFDSLRFENYYIASFKSKKKPHGRILIEKDSNYSIGLTEIIAKNIIFKDLCDVIQFKFDDSDILLRGRVTKNKIYQDGKLLIDLSNDIDGQYYEICDKSLLRTKKIDGSIFCEKEPLIGVVLSKKGKISNWISDANGNFKIEVKNNEEFELIINPCCSSYSSKNINIESNVIGININCYCSKGKIFVRKKYYKNGKIKEKNEYFRL